MPKNYINDVTKSKMTSKSTARKPLRDVSNGVKPLSTKSTPKKKPTAAVNREEQPGEGGDALDRLFLVHSDLSSLIHRIDELVVQALKLTSIKERKEIDSFADVLSEMQVSLKPWVARFQRAVLNVTPEPENNLEQSSPNKVVPALNQEASSLIPCREEAEWDSLVSPSPLVYWRPDCNNDGSRQLFLLTPLPRPKAFSSNCQESAKSVFEMANSTTTVQPSSLFNIEGEMEDNLIEGIFLKPTPRKMSDSNVNNAESTLENEYVSPAKLPIRGNSMLLMTPCLKISPPKSCVLLEPTSALSHKTNHEIRRSTPFPVGVKNSNCSQDFESSSSRASENLTMKYPELFGIRIGHDYGNRRKVVEESPNWLMSPPKTCVLMEPPEEKPVTNAASEWPLPRTAPLQDQQTNSCLMSENATQGNGSLAVKSCKKEPCETSEMVESTPLLKEPESNLQMGKRPGENTLKRELWTKFDAASIHGIRFNASILQKTAQKGFLDRLEEVSSDEKSPVVDGF